MAKFVDKIKDFIAGPYDDEYEDDYYAVSYTQLDVYKRQVLIGYNPLTRHSDLL